MTTILVGPLLALFLRFIVLLTALAMEIEIGVLHGVRGIFWNATHLLVCAAPLEQRKSP